jgi:threonylcarbamoyladenosine tRNA methylthiotransferase MtaB
MNRRYRLSDVVELLWYARERLPRGGIGTDLITGFPGEGREDVEQGIARFLELPFSYLHVFPYSERTGTAATRLPGEVPLQERKRRAARWRSVGERKRAEFLRTLIGTPVEMIVESIDGDVVSGTSREFAAVNARASQLIAADGVKFGSRLWVTPTSVDEIKGELQCD